MVEIINYICIGLFALVIGGMVLAALIGMKKGAIKMTYKLVMTIALICIAVFTLKYMADFLGTLNVSALTPQKTIILTNTTTSENYYIKITTLQETIKNFASAYYYLFNVNGSEAEAAALGLAMTTTILKLLMFIIDMILIVTLGNLFLELLWQLVFKHLFPKTVRKTVKLRILAAFENAVRYFVVIAMILTPFTSIVNAVNQAYQKNKSDSSTSEIMTTIGSYLDAYNNSIFAQTFFNWSSTDGGLTIDGQFMDYITGSTFDNATFNVMSEINGITGMATTIGNYLEDSGSISVSTLLTTNVVDALFQCLENSGLILTILPIAVEIALNSDLLVNTIDLRYVNMDDADWVQELDHLNVLIDEILETGVLDFFYDADGNFTADNLDVWELVKSLLKEENYNHIDKALLSIDKSKLLSRILPALVWYLEKGNDQIANYLPSTFDAINDISWGFDLDVLYNGLYYLYNDVSTELCEELVNMMGGSSSSGSSTPSPLVTPNKAVNEDSSSSSDSTSKLIKLAVDNMDGFSKLFVGECDSDFNALYVDKYGRTDTAAAAAAGSTGPKYCLADMGLFRYLASTVLDLISSAFSSQYSEAQMNQVNADVDAIVTSLDGSKEGKTPTYTKAYKKEFRKIFYVLESFQGHSEAIDTMISGNIIPASGSLSDIDTVHVIPALKKLLIRMDSSDLFYAILTPLLRSVFCEGDMANTFSNVGLDPVYITQGFDNCVSSKTVGHELSKIVNLIEYVGPIMDVVNDSSLSSAQQIEHIANLTDNLARVLDTFYDCEIFNPSSTNDANFLNFIDYVFSLTGTMSINTADLPDGIVWMNTYDADGNLTALSGENGHFVNVIKALTTYGLLTKISEDSSFFGDMSNLSKLVSDYHIDEVFAAVDESEIFKLVLPEFLDSQLGGMDLGLVDEANGMCFHNITSWADESENLCKILTKSATLVSVMSGGSLSIDSFSDETLHDLNDILHSLAESQLFLHRNSDGTTDYGFPGWLYKKITPSLTSLNINGVTYSFVSDPKSYTTYDTWPTEWKGANDAALLDDYKTNYLSVGSGVSTFIYFRDFMSLNTKDSWSALDSYVEWSSSFTAAQQEAYYQQDELSRIVNVIKCAKDIIASGTDVTNLNTSLFRGTLEALNETTIFRVSVASFLEIAASSMGSGGFFDLANANTDYLITCNSGSIAVSDSRDGRAKEIDYLLKLYETYTYLRDDAGVLVGGAFDLSALNASFDTAKVLVGLESVQKSEVFHRQGGKDPSKVTVFQQAIGKLLGTDGLKDIIYSASSPKDTALSSSYANANEKIDYIVEKFFSSDGAATFESYTADYAKQLTELSNIFDVLGSIVGLNVTYHEWTISGGNETYTESTHVFNGLTTTGTDMFDFTSVDWSVAGNSECINTILTQINESSILYDAVPNTISKLLNTVCTNFASNGVDISASDFDVYYNYTYPSVNYNRHYDASEITAYQNLFEDYQDFNNAVGSSGLSDLSSLTSLVSGSNSILKSILRHTHDSFSMHKSRAAKVSRDYTVFEKIVLSVVKTTGLETYAYQNASTRAADLKNAILYITRLEETGNTHALDGTYGYHDLWFNGTNTGEADALLNVLDKALGILGSSGSFDLNNLSVSGLSPESVKNLLVAINNFDITQGAVGKLIEDGFTSIGLQSMLTYNSQVRASYYLNCNIYGGTDGSASDAYCEINNIYTALHALAEYDAGGNFTGYLNVSGSGAITSLISSGTSSFGDLLKFITHSNILVNDNATFTSSGININGKGVLLANVFHEAGSIDDYLTGSTSDEKAGVMTKIMSHIESVTLSDGNDKQCEYEASSLKSVIDNSSLLTTMNSANADDLATNPSLTSTFLSIITSAYDALNNETNHRAYLTSEAVSNILNSAITSEFNNATTNHPTYYHETIAEFHYGALNYAEFALGDVATIYNNVSKVERDGLDGSISFFGNLKSASSLSSIDKVEMAASFEKMGTSHIAKAIYVSRIHYVLAALNLYSGGSLTGAIFTEAEMATALTGPYQASFDFGPYGATLAAAL